MALQLRVGSVFDVEGNKGKAIYYDEVFMPILNSLTTGIYSSTGQWCVGVLGVRYSKNNDLQAKFI
jgi:hypothetical protein